MHITKFFHLFDKIRVFFNDVAIFVFGTVIHIRVAHDVTDVLFFGPFDKLLSKCLD